MKKLDIRIKWSVGSLKQPMIPKCYYFSNGRPTKQLTAEEVRFHVTTGNITDIDVIGWLEGKDVVATPKLEIKKPEVVEKPVDEGFPPGSKELYVYLTGLYRKPNLLSVW